MFDLNAYRERCSELHLSEEKLQEVISMTEQAKKKSARRPLRVGLVAAALCALLVISVSAANPEVLEGWCFWGTWTPVHSLAPALRMGSYTPSFCLPYTGTVSPIHRPVLA